MEKSTTIWTIIAICFSFIKIDNNQKTHLSALLRHLICGPEGFSSFKVVFVRGPLLETTVCHVEGKLPRRWQHPKTWREGVWVQKIRCPREQIFYIQNQRNGQCLVHRQMREFLKTSLPVRNDEALFLDETSLLSSIVRNQTLEHAEGVGGRGIQPLLLHLLRAEKSEYRSESMKSRNTEKS